MILLIAPAFSVVFSVNKLYEISPKAAPDELAHIVFEQNDRHTGWNKFYIYSIPDAEPIEQHRAAGFL